MTTNLFALGNRATSITTIAVLGVVAMLIAPSTSARAAERPAAPLLTQGAGMGAHPSAQVRAVQRALRSRGYDVGAPGVDGRFGPLTRAAVRHMQTDHGLAADGVVGPRTREKLSLTHPARTRRASSAERPSDAVDDPAPATAAGPGNATTAPALASPDESTTLRHSSTNWLAWLLVGLGAVAAAIAAVTMRRTRHGAEATAAVPALKPAEETAARPAQTIPLSPSANGNGHANGNGRANGNGHRPSAETARPTVSPLGPSARVIGYITMSPDLESGEDDGAVAAIRAACERCGWQLVEIVRDRETRPTLERPALAYALERIAEGQAVGLIVSDLRRLSCSTGDLGALMAWFRDADATLVALDLDIDTSTAKGQHVARTLIALSAHKHDRLVHGARGHIVSAASGGRSSGRTNGRNGRPAVSNDPELLDRIGAMRAANMTLQAIADRLNAEGVPTLRGGAQWRPSSIQSALGYRRPSARDHLPPVTSRKVEA